jgi:hypothetical protein
MQMHVSRAQQGSGHHSVWHLRGLVVDDDAQYKLSFFFFCSLLGSEYQ